MWARVAVSGNDRASSTRITLEIVGTRFAFPLSTSLHPALTRFESISDHGTRLRKFDSAWIDFPQASSSGAESGAFCSTERRQEQLGDTFWHEISEKCFYYPVVEELARLLFTAPEFRSWMSRFFARTGETFLVAERFSTVDVYLLALNRWFHESVWSWSSELYAFLQTKLNAFPVERSSHHSVQKECLGV